MPSEPMLSAAQIAAEFGVHRGTVYSWVHAGTLPKPVLVGGVSRWHVRDVERVKNGTRGLRARRGAAKG